MRQIPLKIEFSLTSTQEYLCLFHRGFVIIRLMLWIHTMKLLFCPREKKSFSLVLGIINFFSWDPLVVIIFDGGK
jgi:hypothetical protein